MELKKKSEKPLKRLCRYVPNYADGGHIWKPGLTVMSGDTMGKRTASAFHFDLAWLQDRERTDQSSLERCFP